METIPKAPNQGTHFHGDRHHFPCFGNVGHPYITTLTLPGFTMGLLVWFFSALVASNAPSASPINPPPQEHQPHVHPFPSSPIESSSLSSSPSAECLSTSNQESKKK